MKLEGLHILLINNARMNAIIVLYGEAHDKQEHEPSSKSSSFGNRKVSFSSEITTSNVSGAQSLN